MDNFKTSLADLIPERGIFHDVADSAKSETVDISVHKDEEMSRERT